MITSKIERSAEKTLALLDRHPFVRKIKDEAEQEILQAREETAERIAEIEKEMSVRIPKMQAVVEDAERQLNEHDEKRKELLEELIKAKSELFNWKIQADNNLNRLKGELISSADKSITDAISWFRAKHDTLRAKKVDIQTREGEHNLISWTKKMIVYSNLPAMNAALTYIRTAIQELEALRLLPEFDVEYIKKLKSEIPDPTVLIEFFADKPMPRTDVRPPAIPSFEEVQHQNLLKKANDILRRPFKRSEVRHTAESLVAKVTPKVQTAVTHTPSDRKGKWRIENEKWMRIG